jgi:dihydroorotate dehydrogenase electron transfer subunit
MVRQSATVFEEKSKVIQQIEFTGDQFILTLEAQKSSITALPGEFAFVDCGENIMLRRPLSYLRANKKQKTVEFLYKIIGPGLEALSKLQPGDEVTLMGPIGRGFNFEKPNHIPVLIGGGVGIPPVLFLAEYLKNLNQGLAPVAFFGSELPFPFTSVKSSITIDGIKNNCNASIADMENKDIPCRLASLNDFEGCYTGYVTELAEHWIRTLDQKELKQIVIYACGPEPMLKAAANLGATYQIDCQLSLEEFMACAIGGCAGCVVEVTLPEGVAMKRVCVDGPVFDAQSIFPR